MNKADITIEAKDVESAIKKGLQQLGTSQEQADIEILQDATPGLFNKGERPAKVRVSATGVNIHGQIHSILSSLLKLMGIENPSLDIEVDDDVYRVNIDAGDQQQFVIGPKGKTINALQHLLQSAISRRTDQTFYLRLDAGDYRARRREDLQRQTLQTVEDVRNNQQERELEPMGPIERKIVHMVVNESEGVKSVSIGEDANRRVIIQPIGTS